MSPSARARWCSPRAAASAGARRARCASTAWRVPRPTIADKVLPLGRVGTPYSHQLTGGAAPGPLTWTLTAGALPEPDSRSRRAGLISGTPTAGQTTRATVQVKSSNGRAPAAQLHPDHVAAPSTPSLGRHRTQRDPQRGRDRQRQPSTWRTHPPSATAGRPRRPVRTPPAATSRPCMSATGSTASPWDGVVKAWDSTGSAARPRAAVVDARGVRDLPRRPDAWPATGSSRFDSTGRLNAHQGQRRVDPVEDHGPGRPGTTSASLVVGTSIFIRDCGGNVEAVLHGRRLRRCGAAQQPTWAASTPS